MRISLFDILAPHYCCSCGAVGRIICDNCKKHIVSRSFRSCLVCAKTIRNSNGLCRSCKQKVPFKRIWCVGERCDALKSLIDAYKFERASGAYREIVDLLDEYLPKLPSNMVVVPVPTISTHIRQRGYDHAAKLARELAKRRELPYSTVLRRKTSTVQHTASQGERWQNAREAFVCHKVEFDSCVIVDDIYTTGATLHYAAKTLLDAGAEDVSVAIIARQPTRSK